jgi:hypothetical protein
MRFYVTNKSTVVTDTDFNTIINSLKIYMQNLCTDWKFSNIEVFRSDNSLDSNLPNTIIIFDSIDDPICSEYNFDMDSNSVSRVFAKVIIESGGSTMTGSDGVASVSQQISSTILGLISNYDMNKWYMDPNKCLWWGDISSPVYGNITVTSNDGDEVSFADYVLPSYFGPNGKEGPFNKNNTLMGPFSIDEFGYSIKFENNSFIPTFGVSCQQEIIDRVNLYIGEFRSRFTNL